MGFPVNLWAQVIKETKKRRGEASTPFKILPNLGLAGGGSWAVRKPNRHVTSNHSLQRDRNPVGEEVKEKGRGQGPGALVGLFHHLQRELASGATTLPPLHVCIPLLRYSI